MKKNNPLSGSDRADRSSRDRRPGTSALCAVAVVCLVGCSEDSAAPSSPPAEPVTQHEFESAFRDELDRRLLGPCGSHADETVPDPYGSLGFDPVAAGACLTWLRAQPEGLVMPYALLLENWRDRFVPGTPCRGVYRGETPAPEHCYIPEQCPFDPTSPDRPDCTHSGACTAPVPGVVPGFPGDPCNASTTCVPGWTCMAGACQRVVSEPYTCSNNQARPCSDTAAFGEPCHFANGVDVLLCAPPGYCRQTGMLAGVCDVAHAQENEPCQAVHDCLSGYCDNRFSPPVEGVCRAQACYFYTVRLEKNE
jgi:hypothetical protein